MPKQPRQNTSQADLLANWKRKKKSPAGITQRPVGTAVAATSGQRRLWALQRMYPGNPFYQHGHLYKLTGGINVAALQKSLRAIFERHEILRTNLVEDETIPLLTVRAVTDPELGQIAIDKGVEEARRRAVAFARRPFNLESDPLLRAQLLRLGPEENWLVLSIHHIIGDRGSLEVLMGDFFSVYSSIVAGEDASLPEPSLQFTDYAHWSAERGLVERDLTYWQRELAGDLPQTAFPPRQARPTQSSFRGATLAKSLPPELSHRIVDLAKELGTTPNVIFLSAFQTLHLRYGAQNDVSVGLPISLRDRTELEAMVGFLNETIVLRNLADPAVDTFTGLAKRVKAKLANGLQHRQAPLEELVKRLRPQRVPGANPFFQNMLVYNAAGPQLTLPEGLKVSDEMLDLGVAKFDLTLFATDRGGHFDLTLEYATDLFSGDSATRLLDNFTTLLGAAVTEPDSLLGELTLLGEMELNLRRGWSRPRLDLPVPTTLLERIYQHGRETPDAAAVVDARGTTSYASLLNRADQLAGRLLGAGTKPGECIGLSCGRGVDMAVGILGILRAGAAYVPLDPTYPAARTQYIRRDAGITKTVVGGGSGSPSGTTETFAIPHANADMDFSLPGISGDTRAYLIYTSGSTGRPKGVEITHANLAHSTVARYAYFDHSPESFLLLSSYAFDSSVAGIFWTLSTGGKLVIPPVRSEQDMEGLVRLIERNDVSHTLLLPSLYHLLLEHAGGGGLASLRTVMVAGEACRPATVERHFATLPRVELVNEYGPTEGTVWCTAHRIVAEDARRGVPIGRPIPGVGNHVLSPGGHPTPIGAKGELFISGPGLARGYWQRPELTNERFVMVTPRGGTFVAEDQGAAGRVRAYRTGDLTSYRPDGTIDFHGRVDHQVKIRGYRVEPGEITRALSEQTGVEAAHTVVDGTGEAARIVAYVTGTKDLDTSGLLAELRNRLPIYMVPSVLVSLDELPRLPNGKVDTGRLPAANPALLPKREAYAAPVGDTEVKLAAIWSSILGVGDISRHANYFDLGGDSIHSIRVISEARKAGMEVSPTDLFRYQTLSDLARAIGGEKKELTEADGLGDSIIALKETKTGEPLFCVHSGGGHVFFYQPLAAALPEDRPVYAIQPSTLASGDALPESISEMASDYLREIKKVRSHGPYHLLGTCFSNAVVLEIAHQLIAAGEEVGQLIFVDSGPMQLERQAEVKPPALASAAKFVISGNWHKIRRALYRRWFYVRQAIKKTTENEEEKMVRETTAGLYDLYHQYDWRPVAAPVTLIRSTEFAGRADKKTHLVHWGQLAAVGLTVNVTPGTHLNLFAAPQAKGLAQYVEACLSRNAT